MRIGIYGYGNLGRGVELAARQNSDAELIGIFSRRNPSAVGTMTGAPVYPADSILEYKGKIDVLVICGGSASDLPVITPRLAEDFNVIDSFDTHAKIPEHFENVDSAARAGGNVALISAGWDPGMFSLNRLYASSILPDGKDYTFWGRGVSQGHSEAIRRLNGVIDARQYTVPCEDALSRVRAGNNPELTARQKHTRECYVVAEPGADLERIERDIKTMPNYFSDYDTTVTFITEEDLKRDHAELSHGGIVVRIGNTGMNGEHRHVIEYSLKLDSNPEFTASAIVAFARAVCRMSCRGNIGCKTVFDIAPSDLSILRPEELRAKML